MSKEQINLSDALDLIAQSKADIKDSVEFKGGTIGDDLTEYYSAIDNIKFRSLVMENNVSLFRYDNATTFNVQQYLDGVTSFPDNLDYSVSGDNVTVTMTEESDGATSQRFILTPTGYGDTTLTIKDNVGNCEYPVTVGVGPIMISLDPTWEDNSGFLKFEINDDESSENYGFAEAEWDTSAQAWFLDLTLSDAEGHAIPASAITYFGWNGDIQDYMDITKSTVQGYGNIIRLNITPTACYNGSINITLGDGTCSGDLTIFFIGGEELAVAHSIDVQVTGDPNSGTASADKNQAVAGETVTITVSPNAGYYIDNIDINGMSIQATSIGNNQYTFEMPDEDAIVRVQIMEN